MQIVGFPTRWLNYVCFKIFPAEARTKRSAITVGECCVSRKQVMYTPLYPFLYSKTGLYRGIYVFLNSYQKHRLWVLVRTASPRWFLRVPTTCTHNQCIEQKMKISFFYYHFLFSNGIFSIFYSRKKVLHMRMFSKLYEN